MSLKVIVVGAGVVGAATALTLAEQGYEITVIDKATEVAAGTSGANGAQLSYTFTDAMASPATFKSLPKLLLGLDPAFRLSPKTDPDFLRWGFSFLQNCSASKSDKNTLAILKLALESSVVMNKWRETYHFDFDYRAAKKLLLYESHKALDAIKPRLELKRKLGAKQSIIYRDELLELEPSLQYMNANLVGAVYSPEDEVGDAKKFTQSALKKVTELNNSQVLLETEVQGFMKNGKHFKGVKTNKGDIEADYIVVCGGHQSVSIAKLLDFYLPIAPIAGYSLTYPMTKHTPEISLSDTANKIVLCRVGDRLRVAGMADIGLSTSSLPMKRIKTLQTILKSRFPLAGDYRSEGQPWVGIRPMTSDSRPIIQQYQSSNIFFNCGHGMLGWTLAAGSANRLSKILV